MPRLLFLLLVWFAALPVQAEIAPAYELNGSRLGVVLPDGRRLIDQDLLGVQLSLTGAGGARMAVRIDGMTEDARDSAGGLILYDLRRRDDAGGWQPYCAPDPEGRRAAIFFPGTDGMQITCTAGAVGKCLRFGYQPWKADAAGRPMRHYHAACVRLLRADYCGDGEGFTENGTLVDLYDRAGIQSSGEGADFVFEAAWGPEGAVCVTRTRKPHLLSLEQLRRRCPKVEVRESCEGVAGALVFNRSRM